MTENLGIHQYGQAKSVPEMALLAELRKQLSPTCQRWYMHPMSLSAIGQELSSSGYVIVDGYLSPAESEKLRGVLVQKRPVMQPGGSWLRHQRDRRQPQAAGGDGNNRNNCDGITGNSSSIGSDGVKIPSAAHAHKTRNDVITWSSGKDSKPVQSHLTRVGTLLTALGPYCTDIKALVSRSEAMLACYPGGGSVYKKHVDNPRDLQRGVKGNDRLLTAIVYLNPDWKHGDGGELALYHPRPRDNVQRAKLAPLSGRLLLFWSDWRNPHEVLPARSVRYACTIWCDAGKKHSWKPPPPLPPVPLLPAMASTDEVEESGNSEEGPVAVNAQNGMAVNKTEFLPAVTAIGQLFEALRKDVQCVERAHLSSTDTNSAELGDENADDVATRKLSLEKLLGSRVRMGCGAVQSLGKISLEEAVKAVFAEKLLVCGPSVRVSKSANEQEPELERAREISVYSWADGAKAVSVYIEDVVPVGENGESCVNVDEDTISLKVNSAGTGVELRVKDPKGLLHVLRLHRLFGKVDRATWKCKKGRLVLKLWKGAVGNPWAKLKVAA